VPESSAPGAGDFYFLESQDPEQIRSKIVTMICERIPARFGLDPLRDVQVLTPMHRSELGATALNTLLQEALNPRKDGLPEVQRFGWTFRPGDKVMQIRNNYSREVFNGDIGRVAAVDEMEREILVDFDGRSVVYDFGELDELTLAYATTVHKAQGAEYPAVILPLHTQHYLLLQRNLLYTGITRGKKLVVLIGSRQALELAVQRQDTASRCSALRRRLIERNQSQEVPEDQETA
jgi:exodeoxyribonuclease V alpha subunit